MTALVGLIDCDVTGFPNLALMKLSTYHKKRGDIVTWYMEELSGIYDKIYASKVFTWTDPVIPDGAAIGGTGFLSSATLPDEIEHECPDYSLYPCDKSYGFLTRGCIRSCPECFVPEKEGKIRAHADIDEFCRHNHTVLMDNNVLAHPHGIKQIEKMIKMKISVDFNQGLDARLIDNSMAKLLAKLKWKPSIRLACDSMAMIEPVRKAVELLRWHNATPSQYFCYVLVKGVEDALERVRFLKGIYVYPFCQPYRDKKNTAPTPEQRHFARWVNARQAFRSCTWEDYRYNEGGDK